MTEREYRTEVRVAGPWSLSTSREFWEGFAPAALGSGAGADADADDAIRTVFRVEADWSAASATVRQHGDVAEIEVAGDGDLEAAAAQTARFLALDVDASDWPAVGGRDPVIRAAQAAMPGLRPCGFHSPYEAAAWAVLSQRIRIVQAAALRRRVIEASGDGAFPAPELLRALELELPGRKSEYLRAVAEAALDGRLDTGPLRTAPTEDALTGLRQITGIGPFASELILLRGANVPDALPTHEQRLGDEVAVQYGPGAVLADVAEAWRPFRTWACVHLRSMREQRTHEIGGGD